MAKKSTKKTTQKVVTPKTPTIVVDENPELTKEEVVEEILGLPTDVLEPEVKAPDPMPALPPDLELSEEMEEEAENIEELFKKHITKEAVEPELAPVPTRGHQQKIFSDKKTKKGGGTVKTRFTDIPVRGQRHGNVEATETLPRGPGTTRTTGNTTTCK